MKDIVIDTDVLMDFFLNREPFADAAAKVMSLCESGVINGYITPVIYSNLYYLLRRFSDRETVIGKLRQLFFITQVLVIDKQVILSALNSDSVTDFEDALQNYAIERSKNVRIIVTRNVKDFRKSNISALTPEDFLKLRSQKI